MLASEIIPYDRLNAFMKPVRYALHVTFTFTEERNLDVIWDKDDEAQWNDNAFLSQTSYLTEPIRKIVGIQNGVTKISDVTNILILCRISSERFLDRKSVV